MKYRLACTQFYDVSEKIKGSNLFEVKCSYPLAEVEYIDFEFNEDALDYLTTLESNTGTIQFLNKKKHICKYSSENKTVEETDQKFKQTMYSKLNILVMKRSRKILACKRKINSKYQNSRVIKHGLNLYRPSYKKYYYCDKVANSGWFFRLKPIKEQGEFPVVIYSHGNGLNRAGKNDLQMAEFKYLIKKLNKEKCHQVVIHTDYQCEYNTEEYSRALSAIIDYIEKEYKNVDFNRIYLMGTSHGGYACIYESLRNPNKYAACVCAMGYTYNEKFRISKTNGYQRDLNDNDYQTLSNTAFYLAWAENDGSYVVDSNNLLKENLQKYSAEIKTIEYESGGHTIFGKFFKSDIWREWLFNQKRKD